MGCYPFFAYAVCDSAEEDAVSSPVVLCGSGISSVEGFGGGCHSLLVLEGRGRNAWYHQLASVQLSIVVL